MDSTKPMLPVALADERVGGGWRRSRRAIRTVAVLCSLLAAATVYGLFDRFRVQAGPAQPARELIATVDLRIGTPGLSAERGEALARRDVEAGLLQLQAFGPAVPAKAHRLTQRYGVGWVVKAAEPTPLTQAFADAYNRVMQAEIERRHGREFLDRLLQDSGLPRPHEADKVDKASPP